MLQLSRPKAHYYETAAGNVDPTLGIVKSLIS